MGERWLKIMPITVVLVTVMTVILLMVMLLTGWGESSTIPNDGMAGSPAPVAEGGTAAAEAPEARGGPAPRAAASQVVIDNFTFSPPRLTVPAGTTVTWVNRDDVPHTATSTAKPRLFHSGTLDTDDKFSFTFTTPG